MRLILRLGLAPALGLLAAAQAIVGSWTIVGLTKACEETLPPGQSGPLCTYQFLLGESSEPALPMTWCTISARSLDARGENVAFYDLPCREGGAAQMYRVSSLRHNAGRITMSVIKHAENVCSTFDFKDSNMGAWKSAPARIEPSYDLGSAAAPWYDESELIRRRDGAGGDRSDRRRLATIAGRRLHSGYEAAEAQDGCDPNIWIVRNLERNVRPIMQMVLFRFDMVRCDEVVRCKFDTMGNNPTTVDIKYDNFSDVPCENQTNINVSWGYKEDTDGGIMTLKDLKQHRRAFLGWDNVNGRVKIEEEASGMSEVY